MGKGGSKPKMRVTEYFCSVQYGLCQGPVDSLNRIRINEKIAWEGRVGSESIFEINKQKLYGGIKKEGGVQGYVVWQPGSFTQFCSETVAAKLGRTPANAPAYRGLANVMMTGKPSLKGEDAPIEEANDGGIQDSPISNFFQLLIGSLFAGVGKENGKDSAVGNRNGFYWGANQPYIWPCAFHLTRIPRGWYPEKAAIVSGTTTPRSVHFAIDNSGSMTAVRRNTVKAAFATLFSQLRQQIDEFGLQINLGINLWGGTTNERIWNNATSANIDAAETFIQNGLNAGAGGTDFTQAANGAVGFFDQSLAQTLDRRIMFLITDGEPTDGYPVSAAQSIMSDLLDRGSGSYSTAAGTAVDCYAVNIELEDTQYSSAHDNTTGTDKSLTTGGAVPVIGEGDSTVLADLIMDALGNGNPPSANPAHMIYEALTDRSWGMGANSAALDDTSFRASADIFFNESFGLSMIWTQQQTIQSFVQEILDHVEANLYVDPSTGKFVLKPIRDDYDPETLEVFDESSCTIRDFQRRAPTEIVNEINLTWTNPDTEEEEVITQQDIGGIVVNNGEIISDNRNYYGIRDRRLAATVLARDLAAVTAPLATAEIEIDRSAWSYAPGSVLKLSSEEHDAEELVMRVAKINYGKPGDSKIVASLTQDIFSFARPQVVLPPSTELDSGGKEPTLIEYVEFMTFNYFFTVNLVPPETTANVDYPDVFVGILASSLNTDVASIDVLGEVLDAAGNTYTEPTGTIMPVSRGQLAVAFEQEAETLTPGFSSLTVGSGPTPGGFALIGLEDGTEQGRELVMFVENDGSNWTIKRGILDTVPREWPIGTPIRFFGPGDFITDAELETAFAERDYKLAMQTTLGAFPESLAQTESYTPSERPYLPARPANVKVAGVGFGDVDASDLPDVPVTWANRNRLTEDSQVLAWDDPGVTPEPGQLTKITILDADTREIVNEIADLPDESYTLPKASFGTATRAIVRVTSTRGGYESLQGHEIGITIASGYGFGYGLSYGE